jgi:hypothetical protein
MLIGLHTHDEFMEVARNFHGYPAPGLIIGGYMVELARQGLPACCSTPFRKWNSACPTRCSC